MCKKVIISGLLGAVVLIFWTFAVNGILGFRSKIDMKQIPNERKVYEVLKENVVKPGRYVVNPEIESDEAFPENEPVFSVLYGGSGHEAAGGHMLIGLFIFILVPVIGAWLLSHASDRVLTSYPKKVVFFVGLGLLIAVFSNMTSFGIGNYPLNDALLLAVHNILLWTAIGLVVAWRMKPKQIAAAN